MSPTCQYSGKRVAQVGQPDPQGSPDYVLCPCGKRLKQQLWRRKEGLVPFIGTHTAPVTDLVAEVYERGTKAPTLDADRARQLFTATTANGVLLERRSPVVYKGSQYTVLSVKPGRLGHAVELHDSDQRVLHVYPAEEAVMEVAS